MKTSKIYIYLTGIKTFLFLFLICSTTGLCQSDDFSILNREIKKHVTVKINKIKYENTEMMTYKYKGLFAPIERTIKRIVSLNDYEFLDPVILDSIEKFLKASSHVTTISKFAYLTQSGKILGIIAIKYGGEKDIITLQFDKPIKSKKNTDDFFDSNFDF